MIVSCGKCYFWISWGVFPFRPRRSFVNQRPWGVGFAHYHGSSPHFIFGIIWARRARTSMSFEHIFESLGPILRDVELGGLPTQQALYAARNELDSKAREVLPPFDVLVSTPSPRL